MVQSATLLAIVTMVSWGAWALMTKVAVRSMAPETAMVTSYAASIPLVMAYMVGTGKPINPSGPGVKFALASGVCIAIGSVAFYSALDTGATSSVTTITALYFVVAVILGVLFLDESLSMAKASGVVLAAASIVLLTQ